MRVPATLVLLASLLPLHASAEMPPQPEFELSIPPYGLDSFSYVFPSGLRVIVQQDASAPMVAISTVVNCGAKDDLEGKEGSARLVEYLWHQSQPGGAGTPRVQDLIYSYGGNHHADTFADFTTYFTTAPKESLIPLLELESARMTNPLSGMDAPRLKAGQELARNAWRFRAQSPVQQALPHVYEFVFPEGHAYHRLGEENDQIPSLTLDDLSAFADRCYTPKNTTIMVGGDVEAGDVVNALFWAFEPNQFHPDATSEHRQMYAAQDLGRDPDPKNPADWRVWVMDPNNEEELVDSSSDWRPTISMDGVEAPPDVVKSDIELHESQAVVDERTVVVLWSIPGGYRGDDHLPNVVAGMLTQKNIERFQPDPGVLRVSSQSETPDVSCSVAPMVDAGVLACVARIGPKAPALSIAGQITDQLSEIWNPDYAYVLKPSYRRGVNSSLINVLHGVDNLGEPEVGRVALTSLHAHLSGSLTYQSDLTSQIMGAQFEEVTEFCETYLRRERSVAVLLEPMADDEKIGAIATGEGYHGNMLDGSLKVALSDLVSDENAVAERFHEPDLSKFEKATLENGLQVVAVHHEGSPLATATLVHFGGANSETAGYGAYLTLSQSSSATDLTLRDPDQDPMLVAGQWSTGWKSDYTFETIRGPSGNLDELLWLARQSVETRKFRTDFRPTWNRASRKKSNERLQSSTWWSDQLQYAHMAPDYPLFKKLGHLERAAINDLSATEVKQAVHQRFQPANTVLVIVGNIDPTEAIAVSRTNMESWKPYADVPNERLSVLQPVPASEKGAKTYLLDVPKAQSSLDYSCQLRPWDDAKSWAAQPLLGRLMKEKLRSELSKPGKLVYSMNATHQQYAGGAAFLQQYAVVDNALVAEAVTAMQKTLSTAASGDLDATSFELQKMHFAGEFATRFQTLDQFRSMIVGLLTQTEEPVWDWYERVGEALPKLTVQDLTDQLGDCPSNPVLTIRGPASELEPQLKEAGIAYEVFDWRGAGLSRMAEQDPKAYKKAMKGK